MLEQMLAPAGVKSELQLISTIQGPRLVSNCQGNRQPVFFLTTVNGNIILCPVLTDGTVRVEGSLIPFLTDCVLAFRTEDIPIQIVNDCVVWAKPGT